MESGAADDAGRAKCEEECAQRQQERRKRERERAKREVNLRLLADHLIARHIRISVPDLEVRHQLITQGRAGFDIELVEREMRCIAVVGAGASAAVLKRSNELADELEAEFGRDDAELERLRLVNNLDVVDFEARLVALSKSPPAERKVREKIAEIYGARYPSLLGYELLAHLLKHRFFDAIITFNFDELLDQSLDDEMDQNEYVRVVSERDCGEDVIADPGAPGYVPLYVKLHGTASEPESLRYTPQSYYALPPKILNVVRNLLRCEHCVIANIGSNLGSFDFQRLLRIPRDLDVFNLSFEPVPASVVRKIESERAEAEAEDEDRGNASLPSSEAPPDTAHEDSSSAQPADPDWLLDCNAWEEKSDYLMSQLASTIKQTARDASDGLVDFRSVRRHETLAQLLGPDSLHRGWLEDPEWARREWTEYCRRRTILELAFAGAKARGLMSMVPLTSDRPARYYERYRQRTNGQGDSWQTLCAAAGLTESEETPDYLYSQEKLWRRPLRPGEHPMQRLNKFDVDKLAHHVLVRIKNPVDPEDVKLLRKTFKTLQKQDDVEFHIRDDRVCSKAFELPATLPTVTSRRAYTWLMLQDLGPDDEVLVSSEDGEWLLEPLAQQLVAKPRIRALLAFDVKRRKLAEAYRDRLSIAVVDPWRHNRHMTIVCREGQPSRAIYFARRLRAPVITAVYLKSIRDVRRLMRLFDERWSEGVSFDFRAFKHALEARDIEALESFYAPDAEWIDHGKTDDPPEPPRMLHGRDQIVAHMREVVAAGATAYSVTDEIVNPERVAFAVTAAFPGDRQRRRHVHLYLKRGLIASRVDVEVHGRPGQ